MHQRVRVRRRREEIRRFRRARQPRARGVDIFPIPTRRHVQFLRSFLFLVPLPSLRVRDSRAFVRVIRNPARAREPADDGDGADVLDVRPRRIKRALHRKRSNLPARHHSSGFKQSTDSERETEIDRPERGEGLEMRRRRLGVDDARRRRRRAREDDDPHHRHLRDKYQNRHETIYVCRPTLRTP